MLPDVGMGELLLILAVILLLFGPKKLPELARGLGKSIKAFKEALNEGLTEAEPTKAALPDKEPAPTETRP